MGHTIYLGSTLPPLRFHVSSPNSELICIAWGLFFVWGMLTYDAATNEAKRVPMQRTASDLSLVEEASAWELSNTVLQHPLDKAPRMDHFGECRKGCGAEALH